MTLPRALLAKALGGDSRVVAAFEEQAQKVDDTAASVEASVGATTALQDAYVLTLSANETFTNERVLRVAGGVKKADDGEFLTLSLSDEAAHVQGGHPVYLTAQGPTTLVLPLTGVLATRAGAETLGNKTLAAPALSGLGDYANDAAAATGGVAVGGVYRTGSAVMVRVS